MNDHHLHPALRSQLLQLGLLPEHGTAPAAPPGEAWDALLCMISCRYQEMDRQLARASEMAAVTEVLAGVLHNIGNILNSVNVSAAMLSQVLERSRLPRAMQAAELLAQHHDDLQRFLSADQRGRQLPSYLILALGDLLVEHGVERKEVESIKRGLDHIRGIINLQQPYARAHGSPEVLDLPALLEDALGFYRVAAADHAIELTVCCEALALRVDRHRLLQILLNLVQNGIHALREGRREGRRLSVEARAAGDRVIIEVSDNGVGIAGEHMNRLFSFGFTTKMDGHGFGLHSSAQAAQEMGGVLSAHSEGPGRGARFSLDLPGGGERR